MMGLRIGVDACIWCLSQHHEMKKYDILSLHCFLVCLDVLKMWHASFFRIGKVVGSEAEQMVALCDRGEPAIILRLLSSA